MQGQNNADFHFGFKLFDKKWGPHTFDRFVNSKNCKVEKFNSQFWTGVDAFVCDWSSDNNWLVPPVHCIPNVLKHVLFYMFPVKFGTKRQFQQLLIF
jgi:hypothetical protein